MAYLNHIEPIDPNALIEKIKGYRASAAFELMNRTYFTRVCLAFQGKVINKRFVDALKKTYKDLSLTAWESKDYSANARKRVFTVGEQGYHPSRSKYSFQLEVELDINGRMFLSGTAAKQKERMDFLTERVEAYDKQLSKSGIFELQRRVKAWEEAIQVLKNINAQVKDVEGLEYEFDLCRYR